MMNDNDIPQHLNPVSMLNEEVDPFARYGTVRYFVGDRMFGTFIGQHADRFGEEFPACFGGNYDDMVAFIEEASQHGGILSGFDIVDFTLGDTCTDAGKLVDADFNDYVTDYAWVVQPSGEVVNVNVQ